jgi:hypothetical protein
VPLRRKKLFLVLLGVLLISACHLRRHRLAKRSETVAHAASGSQSKSDQPGQTRGLSLHAPEVEKTAPAINLEKAVGRYGRRIAVSIGINDYNGRPWPRLNAAVQDARRMNALFRDLGFDRLFELHNKDATRASILDLLESKLPQETAPNDLIVIYFAGHGFTEDDRGYIVPVDASAKAKRSMISVQRLKQSALRMRSKNIMFVMDSCFSGSMFRRPKQDAQTSRQAFWEAAREEGVVQIITAGGADQEVLESGGWGRFTKALHEGLRGHADKNRDLVVTGAELATYLKTKVRKDTQAAQTPQWATIDGYGEIFIWDERKLPDELAAKQVDWRIRRITPFERQLAEVESLLRKKEWFGAEKILRKLALQTTNIEINILLAEVYAAADLLGNLELIAIELKAVEKQTLDADQQDRVINLRTRSRKARRGAF